jgi:uncharacterized protein YqjF (DUF2071 family)
LILLTFRVPAKVLRPHVHPQLELDEWEGHCHISVVAFDFQDTRLRGRRIPGFINFPELNLRTYVRQAGQLGVTFIREYVPSRVVATVARLRYNEPYRAMNINSKTVGTGDELRVEHHWGTDGAEQGIVVTASQASVIPPADGPTCHFTEHRWGYGANRRGKLMSYRVEHPTWAVRDIRSIDSAIDFQSLYGPEWAFLDSEQPIRTTLAVGSPIEVFPPGR